jgi:hypothetical protein
MSTDTNDEVVETETRLIEANAEIGETEPRPDLIWDDEARGLCTRVYRDDSKAFIFVYRIDDRQHFIRIGKTPVWSLDAARKRAKKLRAMVDEGLDPATCKSSPVRPVESIIEYIAEPLRTEES